MTHHFPTLTRGSTLVCVKSSPRSISYERGRSIPAPGSGLWAGMRVPSAHRSFRLQRAPAIFGKYLRTCFVVVPCKELKRPEAAKEQALGTAERPMSLS